VSKIYYGVQEPYKIPLPRWERVRVSFAIDYTYASCDAQSVVKSQETVWEKSASKELSEDHA
jgi:hypothetical protein